jgi:hypothetical protein
MFDGEDGGLGGIAFDEDVARFGTAEDVRVGWYDDAGDRVREELGFDMESQEFSIIGLLGNEAQNCRNCLGIDVDGTASSEP